MAVWIMVRFKSSRDARQRVRLLQRVALTAVAAVLLLLAGRRSSTVPPPQAAAADQPRTVLAAAAGAAAGQAQRGSDSAGATGDSGGNSSGSRVVGTYVDVGPDGHNITRQLLEEQLPSDCHAEPHADYDGPGLNWGLTFKRSSAAQCCQECKQDARCNVWVFCGDPSGLCWSPDVWNHTSGECWLKRQEEWDGSTDLSTTNLAVNHRGLYPADYRAEHTTAPEVVQWVSGLIPRPRPT